MNNPYLDLDHTNKEYDLYALGKYRITLNLLRGYESLAGSTGRRLILNIGCGGGYFNRMAIEHGYRVAACEPDLFAFNLANSNPHPDLEMFHGELNAVSLPTKPDIIVMHDVLEHIDAEDSILREISQMLSPEGQFILSVPAIDRLFGQHDIQAGHFRRYNKMTIRRVLMRHFDIDSIRYYGFFGIPATFYFSRLTRKDYPALKADTPTFLSKCLKVVVAIESKIALPLGTSLIVVATPKKKVESS